MRLSRLAGRKLELNVSSNVVQKSEGEQIIGILANNKLTWWHQLYGDKSDPKKQIPGLTSYLSKCLGLVNLIPKHKFIILVDGIFNSNLYYCLKLWGYAWGADTETQP